MTLHRLWDQKYALRPVQLGVMKWASLSFQMGGGGCFYSLMAMAWTVKNIGLITFPLGGKFTLGMSDDAKIGLRPIASPAIFADIRWFALNMDFWLEQSKWMIYSHDANSMIVKPMKLIRIYMKLRWSAIVRNFRGLKLHEAIFLASGRPFLSIISEWRPCSVFSISDKGLASHQGFCQIF